MAIITSKDSAATARILCILLLGMVAYVSADLAADKKECQDHLIGLSPCLTFVGGDSKTPTPACCTELGKDVNKTRKCLCLLVKDRNEPDLGFKINATLALSLPSVCHVPSNISNCPALLHLATNSPDAQVFEQFSSTSTSNGNNTVIGDIPTSSSSTVKGRWVGLRSFGKVTLWLVISAFISQV